MIRITRQSRGLCLTAILAVAWLGLTAPAGAESTGEVIIPWLSGDHVLSEDTSALPGQEAAGTSSAEPAPAFLQRPRLSVALIDSGGPGPFSGSGGFPIGDRFSLGMGHWKRSDDTGQPAQIFCQRGTLSSDRYLAEDCRVVSGSASSQSPGLLHLDGRWMATSSINLGFGLFRGESVTAPFSPEIRSSLPTPLRPSAIDHSGPIPLNLTEGMDVNMSLELEAGRVGDFLLDLQVARFRNTSQISYQQTQNWIDTSSGQWTGSRHYQNAAQLSLGWNRGDFSGGIIGQYRDPTRLSSIDYAANQAQSSFDIEFSWRAPWNASFAVGASNVLDQQPVEAPPEAMDDQGDSMFGRIPYVRYKQDL